MFWFVENLILSNVLITGESNFDEKNVKEIEHWTDQRFIQKRNTIYKIGTLVWNQVEDFGNFLWPS